MEEGGGREERVGLEEEERGRERRGAAVEERAGGRRGRERERERGGWEDLHAAAHTQAIRRQPVLVAQRVAALAHRLPPGAARRPRCPRLRLRPAAAPDTALLLLGGRRKLLLQHGRRQIAWRGLVVRLEADAAAATEAARHLDRRLQRCAPCRPARRPASVAAKHLKAGAWLAAPRRLRLQRARVLLVRPDGEARRRLPARRPASLVVAAAATALCERGQRSVPRPERGGGEAWTPGDARCGDRADERGSQRGRGDETEAVGAHRRQCCGVRVREALNKRKNVFLF